jgi:hypothetical protein
MLDCGIEDREKVMVKAPRPQKLEGTTLKIKTPCGVVYVMIQSHPESTSKPFEIFAGFQSPVPALRSW